MRRYFLPIEDFLWLDRHGRKHSGRWTELVECSDETLPPHCVAVPLSEDLARKREGRPLWVEINWTESGRVTHLKVYLGCSDRSDMVREKLRH